MSLGNALKKSFDKADMSSSFVKGNVVAREEDKGTCTNHYFVRRIDDATVVRATLDLRMRNSCLDTYAIKIAIGSYVLMYPQGEGELFVIVKFAIADILSINVNDFLRLNGDDLGGLVKVNELSKRVAALELKLAALETAFDGHTHKYSKRKLDAPSGVATDTTDNPTLPSVTDEQINTRATAIVGDLSNSKVKHGEL